MKIVQKQIGRQDRLPAVPSFWKFFHNLNVLELYFAPTCRRRLAWGSHPLKENLFYETVSWNCLWKPIFNRPLLHKGVELQEEILSVCLFVRHHFFLRVNRRDILQKLRQFSKGLEPDFSNLRQIRVKSVFANFKHNNGPNMLHRVHL